MASDVEVLRLWLQSFESHPSSMPVLFPSMEQLSALSSAIVALERVEHIAQALGVVVDRIDADQYDTKAAIARDIIAALRPPSKPETP